MSQVTLGYGRGRVAFEFEDGRFEVLEPAGGEEPPLTDAEVGAALDDPFDAQPLEEKFSIRVRPAASEASIAARRETDLSPGTLRRPRSRLAGLIRMRPMLAEQ